MPKPPNHHHLLKTLTTLSSTTTSSSSSLRRISTSTSDSFSLLLFPSSHSHSPTTSFFNKLINSAILSNHLSHAHSLFSQLQLSHLPLTNPSYSLLLKLHFLLRSPAHPDLPYSILSQMLKSNCPPDSITYSTLVYGLCYAGRIEEAWGIIDRMIEENCPPTVRCYTSIVLAYCNDRRVEMAEGLVERMASFGCPPDDVTYTVLIGGFCGRGEFGEVERLLGESEEKGWRPNEVTYKVYINGLCKAGRVDEARRLLDVMRGSGLCPAMESLHAVFEGFCRDLSGERLRELGCLLDWDVDVYFYNTVMGRLREIGRWEDVLKLWASMVKRGIEPDICTYTIVIHCFCKQKMLREAKYVFYRMDFEPDVVAFNTLLLGFFKEDMIDEVCLLSEMIGKNINPNEFTYCIMIDGFCRQGMFSEAVDWYQQSIRYRFLPKLIARPVRWLVKDGHFMEVINLFEKILERGFVVHGFVFDSLIMASCKKGLCQSVGSNNLSLIFNKMLGIR